MSVQRKRHCKSYSNLCVMMNVLFVLRICPTALNGKNCDYGHPSSNKKQEITVEIIWLKTGMKVNRMKYTSTLLAVSDMEKSKQFYHDVLGMDIVNDFGANVTLNGGIALQTMGTRKTFVRTGNIILPNNAVELYFEEDNMNEFCRHLETFEIYYVHELTEHRWGQRVIRFYDPDGHIIEVGENMEAVVRRFIQQGLTEEETAARMDVPFDYIISCLKGNTSV